MNRRQRNARFGDASIMKNPRMEARWMARGWRLQVQKEREEQRVLRRRIQRSGYAFTALIEKVEAFGVQMEKFQRAFLQTFFYLPRTRQTRQFLTLTP